MPEPKKGLVEMMVRLTPEQAAALRREALKGAPERGSMRPDGSEIVREALDAHMRRLKRW